jgi:hypothetical protein
MNTKFLRNILGKIDEQRQAYQKRRSYKLFQKRARERFDQPPFQEYMNISALTKQVIASNPDYLDSRKWYDRQAIVDTLRRMNYSDVIAQELADWFLLHIRSAFNRGIFSAISHLKG